MAWLICLFCAGLACVAQAEDSTIGNNSTITLQPLFAIQTNSPLLIDVVIRTNGAPCSFALSYTATVISEITTNQPRVVSLTGTDAEQIYSDFSKFVIRHITDRQEFRFICAERECSRARKMLASISSGYGDFFDDDIETSVTFRGNNGTRMEFPGFLYLRSGFSF